MGTRTRQKRTTTAPPADTRQTISPLDESLPKQTPSLDGQQTLPVELPPGKPPAGQVRPGLVEFLKQFDMEAFLDNWPRKELRRRVDARYGTERKRRVSGKELNAAAVEAFDWYGRTRLCPERSNGLLTADQWDEMKRQVQKQLELMHGRTLRQCVRICRIRISCSSQILQGLPKQFHVWSDAK